MCAIVLEAWYDKVSYPDLRRIAQEAYSDWQPDAVLIEKKASGQSLLPRFAYGRHSPFWRIVQTEIKRLAPTHQAPCSKTEEFSTQAAANGLKI
jgi:hypothetical protein